MKWKCFCSVGEEKQLTKETNIDLYFQTIIFSFLLNKNLTSLALLIQSSALFVNCNVQIIHFISMSSSGNKRPLLKRDMNSHNEEGEEELNTHMISNMLQRPGIIKISTNMQ